MKDRDISIDILRGIAIFAMIAANMGAHSLAEPHSSGFRFYGSLAAPLFVFLAGLMVVYTLSLKSYKIGYYLKRAGMIFLIAVLIDVLIWGTLPFVTFDVLYLIALAMPVIYYFHKLPAATQLGIILLIFGVTPFLQHHFGYNATAQESPIADLKSFSDVFKTRSLAQFFIDGWFPLFPWLGVSLLGAFTGTLKFKMTEKKYHQTLFIGGSISFVTGATSWILLKPVLMIRDGYSELFYPPTIYYMLTFMGIAWMLIPIIYKVQKNVVLKQLTVYGRASMLVYILHTIFIVWIFNQIPTTSFWPYVGLYLFHAVILWFICFGVQTLMAGKKPPFMVSFILGK